MNTLDVVEQGLALEVVVSKPVELLYGRKNMHEVSLEWELYVKQHEESKRKIR